MEFKVEKTPTVFFVRLQSKEKAFLTYKVVGNVMELIETYTPPEFRGKGIAALMVKEAIKYAREKGLRMKPVCSYAIYFFKKHKEERDVLINEYRKLSDWEWDELFSKRLTEEKLKKS